MGDKNVISDVASERALKVSEERYRRLFEAARDGILMLDANTGRIVDVNPFLTDLTGYSREEFLDKTLWEIGPFKDAGASKASFARLQEQKYIRYDDLPLKARAGGTVDVEFISNVYLVGDWRMIQCNVRDVSARKRAGAERQLLTTAIARRTASGGPGGDQESCLACDGPHEAAPRVQQAASARSKGAESQPEPRWDGEDARPACSAPTWC